VPRPPAPSPSPTASLGPLPTARPSADTTRTGGDFVSPNAGLPRPSPILVAGMPDRHTVFEHTPAPVPSAAAKARNLKEIFALLAAGPAQGSNAPRA
jgi:hypothetical protein